MGVHVLIMSEGMHRRKVNSSRWYEKQKVIQWRLEFVFQKENIKLATTK